MNIYTISKRYTCYNSGITHTIPRRPEKHMVFGRIMQLKSLCIIRLGLYPCRKLPTYFSDEPHFL